MINDGHRMINQLLMSGWFMAMASMDNDGYSDSSWMVNGWGLVDE